MAKVTHALTIGKCIVPADHLVIDFEIVVGKDFDEVGAVLVDSCVSASVCPIYDISTANPPRVLYFLLMSIFIFYTPPVYMIMYRP